MKKTCLLLTFILSFSGLIYAQPAFKDASDLSGLVENGKFKNDAKALNKIGTVLNNYLTEKKDSTSSYLSVFMEYMNPGSVDYNPYIASLIPDPLNSPSGAERFEVTEDRSLLSTSSGINVPMIADGIAKFLVERFKEEMTINFFNRFKDKLNDPEMAELKIMFPKTFETLNAIDKDVYQFALYMDMLRDAFEKDMRALPVNLFKLLRSDQFQAVLDSDPMVKNVLNIGVDIAEGIMNKEHPGEMIENMNMRHIMAFKNPDLTSTMVFFKEMSQSFKSGEGDNYWLSADLVKDHIEDTTTLKLYLGLLYQNERIECKNIQKQYGASVVYNMMDTIGYRNFEKFLSMFQSFINISASIESVVEKMREDRGQEITYLDVYDYYSYTIQILEECVVIYEDVTEENAPRELTLSIYAAKTTGQIYLDAGQRNYVSAVVNSIALLDTLFQPAFTAKYFEKNKLTVADTSLLNTKSYSGFKKQVADFEKLSNDSTYKLKSSAKEIKEFMAAIKDRELKTKITHLYHYYKLTKLDNFLSVFMKYGNFAASIAQAKTSDEVKDIIKAAVLPPGSSAAKTYSSFSIALNAYVGVSAGHEFHNQSRQAFNSLALWAPIGVSFNYGFGEKAKKIVGTLGLNVTIIDLGALVSFRLDDDSTDVLPQFNAQNLLAPGAYITLGRWFNTPLTLGFGAQYGPQLRTISATGADVTGGYWRLNLTLSCDIPFFYMYRRPKNIMR